MSASATADLALLEVEIGHVFRDRELLARALTHRSWAFEKNRREQFADNEQLEFLGDSILGFVVTERLIREFPAYSEGPLTALKAHLVSAAHLYEVATDLRLGDYLLLGRGEEMTGGRSRRANLANALEALIAAVYLDGGIEPVRAFIVDRIMAACNPGDQKQDKARNYKSELQDASQAKKLPWPVYETVEERGPGQARIFVVEVRVGSESARAEGLTKKSAGQNAARRLLEQMAITG